MTTTGTRRALREALRWTAVGLCGLAAVVLAAASAERSLGLAGEARPDRGVLLHGVAAAMALLSAALGGRAEPGDRPALVAMICALPLFGPALGWALLLRPRSAAVADAHRAFEEGRRTAVERLKVDAVRLRRPVVGFARIAERGSFEERRNLLRQLARLGEPRHLETLRAFLRDADTELRLCAYAELTRIGERHEAQIAACRQAAEAADDQRRSSSVVADARAAVAAASLAYGRSGALEAEMADYWLQQAVVWAERALEAAADHVDSLALRADALASLGDLETAWHDVEALSVLDPGARTARITAAVAFRRADYGSVRRALATLKRHGGEVPAWLAATEEVAP